MFMVRANYAYKRDKTVTFRSCDVFVKFLLGMFRYDSDNSRECEIRHNYCLNNY